MSAPMEDRAQFERQLNEAFSTHARVQTVLHAILKVETHEDGTQSFVELLKPSPTVQGVVAAMGLEDSGGGMDWSEFAEGGGRTLKAVTARLDKVLRGLDMKWVENGTLEAKLKEFEEEVDMPEEGRGGLLRMLSEPGAMVDAVVMFLSTYFDAASPPEGGIGDDVLANLL